MIKVSLKNRRARKLKNKIYRRYGDIWGRLALKKRDNFITNLVYNFESQTISYKKRHLPKKKQKKLKTQFTPKNKQKMIFAFQTNIKKKSIRRRPNSRRGKLLKLRRKISLYYGGGRIRKKTFRRYGKNIKQRQKLTLDIYNNYQDYNPYTYGAIIESRLDVLLLRANFVDSIYRARAYIFNSKCRVQGQKYVNHPGFLVRNYQIFGLIDKYTKKLRHSLFIRIKKHAILSLPSYLQINFALLIAFKIEDPYPNAISYPFAEQRGTGANFRKAFSFL